MILPQPALLPTFYATASLSQAVTKARKCGSHTGCMAAIDAERGLEAQGGGEGGVDLKSTGRFFHWVGQNSRMGSAEYDNRSWI